MLLEQVREKCSLVVACSTEVALRGAAGERPLRTRSQVVGQVVSIDVRVAVLALGRTATDQPTRQHLGRE